METQQLLLSIQHEIEQIKKILVQPATNLASEKWIPRSTVMQFFNYGATQMAALENSGDLIVAKIGKRKFVFRESIEKLLAKNQIFPK